MAFYACSNGGQLGLLSASRNIWKKRQFNVICNDCAAHLSIEVQEGRGFEEIPGEWARRLCLDKTGHL